MPSEAPLLESFLDLFSSGAVNYCVICLRTQNERRLVHNRVFKEFTNAMKIAKIWQHHLICFTCERQAINALKFYKAAKFAAAIDTIFVELMYQKKMNRKTDIWKGSNFNKILKELNLDCEKSTAADWDKELAIIRKTTQLNETIPLVVDNRGPQTQTHKIEKTIESCPAYIVPDAPPPERHGQVTGVAVCSGGITLIPRTAREGGAPAPDLYSTDMTDEPETSDDSLMLGSQQPEISEALVIYEDEDEQNDLTHIKISNIESKSSDPHQSTSQPMKENTIVTNDPTMTPPKTPRLILPLESLFEKPKEIFTGDSLLIGSQNGNYTLHPIAIKEGITTVPSLNAKIVNGQLVYDTQPILPIITLDSTNKTLSDLIKAPPQQLLPFQPTNEILNQANIPNRLQKAPIPTNIHQAKVKVSEPNCSKRELTEGQREPQIKKKKELPVEDATESKERIDWEDKIPMDVISFIGAVDPNSDRNKTAKVQNSQIQPRTYSKNICHSDVVIDLC